jgi:hypothetical protein
MDARVASSSAGGSFHIELNRAGGNLTGTLMIPDTGGWQTWTTVSRSVLT